MSHLSLPRYFSLEGSLQTWLQEAGTLQGLLSAPPWLCSFQAAPRAPRAQDDRLPSSGATWAWQATAWPGTNLPVGLLCRTHPGVPQVASWLRAPELGVKGGLGAIRTLPQTVIEVWLQWWW